LAGARDVVSKEVFDEPMDGSEPAVARGGRVAARRLEVVEERQNSFHADVVELEAGNVAPRTLGEKKKEESEGVTVSADGMRARATSALQVISEVRFDVPEDGVLLASHGRAFRTSR
jgi:hypothetical protein